MSRATYILIAVVIIGRLLIEPRLSVPTWEGSYEALAHLYVGGLIGWWWKRRDLACEKIDGKGFKCLMLAVALSLFELVMFLYQKATA